MKCPTCREHFHSNPEHTYLCEYGDDERLLASHEFCPACNQLIVDLTFAEYDPNDDGTFRQVRVWPTSLAERDHPPAIVPDKFKSDYIEACRVLEISPKASAALSRRCIQNLIHNKLNVKKGDLRREIEEVISSGVLPGLVSDQLDAVRVVGNFAAHPIKSTNSGEILDVELAEAEWNLDTVESMFDALFVQPERLKDQKEALNRKLADAGKPPIK